MKWRGFSLLEVLVALMVLGISVMGMSVLVVSALSTSTAAQLQNEATQLLSDAHELAAVGTLDAAATGRWQFAVAAQLPSPSDPLAAAVVAADAADPTGHVRKIAVRWAEPGYRGDRDARLRNISTDWLLP